MKLDLETPNRDLRRMHTRYWTDPNPKGSQARV